MIQIMKRRGILFLIIFLISVCAGFGAEGDDVRAPAPARMSISKVKVFLDEEELTLDSPADGKNQIFNNFKLYEVP